MKPVVSALLALSAIAVLSACGSSRPAGLPSTLRVFDPSGKTRAEISLGDILRQHISVDGIGGKTDLYLRLTSAGDAQCALLSRAMNRSRDRSIAVEVAGHTYTVDPFDIRPASFGEEQTSSLEVQLLNATPYALVRRLRIAKIADIPVGTQRPFVTPGPNGASCEMDFGMPDVGGVYCLSYHAGRPFRTAISVSMDASGKLKPCHGEACLANGGASPTLPYGQSVTLGPWRCTASRAGTQCVVTKTGRGFLLAANRLSPING